MVAAAGDNHTRLADLAPPFVVRHVYIIVLYWNISQPNDENVFSLLILFLSTYVYIVQEGRGRIPTNFLLE